MLDIQPLTPQRGQDFVDFFDGPAFMDNPEWGDCYCMFFHFEGSNEEWDRACQTGANRAAQTQRIAAGTTNGYLAYEQGRPIGWVNAAPRTMLPKLDRFCPVNDAAHVGDIVCFVIAHTHRRRGVARELLTAACDGFVRRGLTIAEAFPPKEADSDAHSYRGPLSLYEGAGFRIENELKNHFQVRKSLVNDA